jgi:glycosyltransferase involved in cell wall biosynthesis
LAADARPLALMLAAETPYPLAGGGALRTASLLHYLSRKYRTDLIVFRQPGAPDPGDHLPAGLVRRVTVIDLPAQRRSRAARIFRNTGRLARRIPPLVDRFAGFGEAVEHAIQGRRYEVGVVEHFWCAPYWRELAPACVRTVLDLHNIESVLHQRCAATENGVEGLAHRVFHQASLRLERRWLPRYSELLAVSNVDAAIVRAAAPQARIRVYPNAIPAAPLPPRGDEEVIIFSGNMEYHPNRSAVRFFRREVWPLLRERWPGLVWRLIGKNPEAVREFTSGDPKIEVMGSVADAVSELAQGRLAVVPLLAGSGTRLKILEAWAAGLPVVSTTLGAEGLPVCNEENILLADDAAALAEAVSRLLACSSMRQKLGHAGRLLLEKEFTWEVAWKSLDL